MANKLTFNEKRLFVVSNYLQDETGKMVPEHPDLCPLKQDDDLPCKISINHDRKRKTGPEHPIRVLICTTHNKAFTVYPPGFVPYGRQLLAPIARDGDLISGASESPFFSGTFFDAALDAADNQA